MCHLSLSTVQTCQVVHLLAVYTDLPFDKDSPYRSGSSEWPSLSLPTVTVRRSELSLWPLQWSNVLLMPNTYSSTEDGGHHHQMVGNTLVTAKLGWLFSDNPSWPTLTWPSLLLGTPRKALIFKHSFIFILILVKGRWINRYLDGKVFKFYASQTHIPILFLISSSRSCIKKSPYWFNNYYIVGTWVAPLVRSDSWS